MIQMIEKSEIGIDARDRNCCTITAVCSALGVKYNEVANHFKSRMVGHGIRLHRYMEILERLGFQERKGNLPRTLRHAARQLTQGRYVVISLRHATGIRDGVLYDTFFFEQTNSNGIRI